MGRDLVAGVCTLEGEAGAPAAAGVTWVPGTITNLAQKVPVPVPKADLKVATDSSRVSSRGRLRSSITNWPCNLSCH